MSEPIYGQWFDVREVPIPDDPEAWVVTAQKWTETDPMAVPSTVSVFSKPRLAPYVDREHADAWMRIPPPPWLTKEGK